VVPVGASDLDAAAMTDLLTIVELAKDYNPTLDVRVLLSRIDSRTKDTADMLKYLAEHKLNVLDARICERVAYRRVIGEGLTVQEMGRDLAASAEIEAVFKEVTR
jgi:chromosome partitioning protein